MHIVKLPCLDTNPERVHVEFPDDRADWTRDMALGLAVTRLLKYDDAPTLVLLACYRDLQAAGDFETAALILQIDRRHDEGFLPDHLVVGALRSIMRLS